MGRKACALGPFALRLIEDAPIDLVRAVLSLRESENEPAFEVPRAQDNDQARQPIIDVLSRYSSEDLGPIEQRCGRILRLADGKGPSSLDTVAGQQLDDQQRADYSQQLDSVCRSTWTYLNVRTTFDDAESFYLARQFRDYGKLYDAFEIELDHDLPIDAAAVDEAALATRITQILDLKGRCAVRALNLPHTEAHPDSVMLIVRHGGPLSSIFDHRDDGQRKTIYFRPANEATLIYTPAIRRMEVCADSPLVRQMIGRCFAEETLGHDVSRKPLTWRQYDLSRFRLSLTLPLPEVEGFELLEAKVLEIEFRLGNWKRKLSLKVAIDDDIASIADRYLGSHNVISRSEGCSRVTIAVRYHPIGDKRGRTLNITISGSNSCNLQSNKDPEQRNVGYALLQVWGIMSAFRQIETTELRSMFPQLLKLFERGEDEITGQYLREIGLDPVPLVLGGFLERRGRQDCVLLAEGEGPDREVSVEPGATPNQARLTGHFGEDWGEHPVQDLSIYQLNSTWLHETLVGLFKPLLATRATQILHANLTLLGSMKIDDAQVPVYFARCLDHPKTINTLDLLLRGRSSSGFGIVLSASSELLACLGPNVVIPLSSHLSDADEGQAVLRSGLELAFRSGRSAATGASSPVLLRYGAQSATLYIPGKLPLSLVGAKQITLFARLVDADRAGSPNVKAATLLEGMESTSPPQCFRADMWKAVLGTYIVPGVRRGYWRLAT